ncbi:MAG: hypothetical protein K8T90_12810 [Planctomycetes bacterium]|nr:hypothetical protein [Planctomycetota bacterium]
MNSDALRALREKFTDVGETVSFADLSEPLLMDLALGWHSGRPFAEHAAALLSRIDTIPEPGRAAELAGRALLTILARRRAGVVPTTSAENVRLLGDPAVDDEGDPEGARAFERREQEYSSLSDLTPPYTAADFAADAAGAFTAAKTRADEGRKLPPDRVGPEHRLALLGTALPPGLRAWFHGDRVQLSSSASREGAAAGDAAPTGDADRELLADATAWKFVLVSRALARHRDAMAATGVLDGQGTAVPLKLLEALLATDLGDLARTALFD